MTSGLSMRCLPILVLLVVVGASGSFVFGAHKDKHASEAPSKSAAEIETAAVGDAGIFDVIATDHVVYTMALTEDGRYLVIAHDDANLLTIWDVAVGKVIANVATPTPQALLCRGDEVFVGSRTSPMIRVYSQKDWKPSNELSVGKSGVYLLSAAGGKNFKGQLFVSCGNESGGEVVLIDAERDARRGITNKYLLACVSWDGDTILSTNHFSVGFAGFSFRDFVDGRNNRNGPERVVETRDAPHYLYQVGDGYWFGDNKVMGGKPLEPILESRDQIIVPDKSGKLVYCIGKEQLVAKGLNTAFPQYGSRPVVWPAEVRDRFDAVLASERRRDKRIYDAPLAATIDGQLHLFVIDNKKKCVLTANVPAYPTATLSGGDVANAPATVDPLNRKGWPATVTVGTKIRHRVSNDPASVKLTLVGRPPGAKFEKDGYLEWTASDADEGEQTFKFRAEQAGQISFHRLSVAVVKPAKPASPVKSEKPASVRSPATSPSP